ncbi:hypothetical protein ATO00_12240 [Loigolactobacillus coryniformis subsp. coryniformis]|nr:hypothetical protein LC20001_10455 [Loigolactobacillus coryniformis subsp. coryniformis KCTC 3167 = DSM 20001]OEH89309.1 hypothetical protein ATO00_12240 [Loigolactobacillus coryniformis subsp. coryniformis]
MAILYTYLLRPEYKDATDYHGIMPTARRLFRQARAILAQMPEKLYLSLIAIFLFFSLSRESSNSSNPLVHQALQPKN